MKATSLFFELIQVAIGNREELTLCPSDKKWALVYSICKKQSLIGIGYAGITRLPKEQRPPMVQFAQWIHDGERISGKNAETTALCGKVSEQLTNDGLWNCILKGQSNILNYPEWLKKFRNCGDIDVWTWPIDKVRIDKDGASTKEYSGIRGTIEYALMLARHAGCEVPEVRYNHVELPKVWPTDVEIHHRPSFMNCMYNNSSLQKWCKKVRETCTVEAELDGSMFRVATNSFNAIYQLSHIYCHLFDEGIGLRQLMDYYFVLKALHKEQNSLDNDHYKQDIMSQLKVFGMDKFASAVMYVLKAVFAMPDDYLLCPINKKEGIFLLSEIMLAGNFGHYDKRISREKKTIMGIKVPDSTAFAWEKTKHNMRLFSHYPKEVMWEPFFRIYHFLWRRMELWKY